MIAKFNYHSSCSCYMCPKCFWKISGKWNNYQFYLPNFLKFWYNISHKFWDQSPSPHYQCCFHVFKTASWHKTRSCFSSNIAAHWKSRNSEACAKKQSQIHANNINNGGEGGRRIGLRNYVRYCRCTSLYCAANQSSKIGSVFSKILKNSARSKGYETRVTTGGFLTWLITLRQRMLHICALLHSFTFSKFSYTSCFFYIVRLISLNFGLNFW